MDWRCSGDQQTASTQTKDGPRGCPTLAEVATRKSLSSNLGTESGESRSAATALAPASAGADAHADYESTTGRGDERGLSLEEKAVQRKGTSTARETLVGSPGPASPGRVTGAGGPTGSKDLRTNASGPARNPETAPR